MKQNIRHIRDFVLNVRTRFAMSFERFVFVVFGLAVAVYIVVGGT